MRPYLKRVSLFAVIAVVLLGALSAWQWQRVDVLYGIVASRLRTPLSVEERLVQYGDAVQARLAESFAAAGVAYPPKRITLIGLKEEKLLELWAEDSAGVMRRIKVYPVRAASGRAGPKLREGDRQVPEGIYAIESLNPNSRYHLALRVNYPNATDLAYAKAENRTNPGSDIMIHGKAVSIGCLAMGDSAAEELFVLAAEAGVKNIQVLLCPYDFRKRQPVAPSGAPDWINGIYAELEAAIRGYRAND